MTRVCQILYLHGTVQIQKISIIAESVTNRVDGTLDVRIGILSDFGKLEKHSD